MTNDLSLRENPHTDPKPKVISGCPLHRKVFKVSMAQIGCLVSTSFGWWFVSMAKSKDQSSLMVWGVLKDVKSFYETVPCLRRSLSSLTLASCKYSWPFSRKRIPGIIKILSLNISMGQCKTAVSPVR